MDCAAPLRSLRGSLPRIARCTTATSASSASRAGDRPASGARLASCSGVARAAAAFTLTALELEHQVVLQHAGTERPGAFLDLQHRRLDLPGLHVRDVDLGRAL